MKKVLIVNGPNMNMLGSREKDKYGLLSLDEINDIILKYAKTKNIEVSFFQSNSEGNIIDKIQTSIEKHDFCIINAGAYTHYSYAIRDAIASIEIPVIEVHITNINKREVFRKTSVIAPVCIGTISGFGYNSYLVAIDAVSKLIER